MADDTSKQEMKDISKKIDCLQSLISNLKKECNVLKARTGSKTEMGASKLVSTLGQKSKHHSTQPPLLKESDIKIESGSRTETLQGEHQDAHHSKRMSKCKETPKDSGKNKDKSCIQRRLNSNVGISDERLSKLAKEIWSKNAEHRNSPKQFSMSIFRLSDKEKLNLRKGRTCPTIKSHLSWRKVDSACHGSKQIFASSTEAKLAKETCLPPEHVVDDRLHLNGGVEPCFSKKCFVDSYKEKSSTDTSHFKSHPTCLAGIGKDRQCPLKHLIGSNKKQCFVGMGNASSTAGLNEEDKTCGACDAATILRTSSERLSSLAREAWKGSSYSKICGKRCYKGAYALENNDNSVFVKAKGQDSRSKDTDSAVPSTSFSTDDHLSQLAKEMWQRQNRRGNFVIAKGYSLGAIRTGGKSQYRNSGKEGRCKQTTSVFKWFSHKDETSSFLSRRKRVIMNNSRYNIIGYNASLCRHRRVFRYSKQKAFFVNRWSRSPHTKQSVSNISMNRRNTKKDSKVFFTNIHGKKFFTDTSGRRLRKVSRTSSTSPSPVVIKENLPRNAQSMLRHKSARTVYSPNRYKVIRRPSSTHTQSSKLTTAGRVIRKSVFRIHKENARKFFKKQYCMFYNRFGKCKNGEKCRYLHDPDKVAVCTRFLRGTCKDDNCLFSHKVDSKKMPTCSFFLSGVCHRENCPFAHVKVSNAADICKDFLKGFCPSGDKCLKRHVLECEQFSLKGSCPDGDKCKMYHRKRYAKRRRSSSLSGTKIPRPFAKRMKRRRHGDEIAALNEPKGKDLKIKPSFASAKNPEQTAAGMTRLKWKRVDWKGEKEDGGE